MTDRATVTLTTPTDREIVLSRSFDAPARHVFEAWTNPKYMTKWMTGPRGWVISICETDLRVGGSWRCIWRKPDGSDIEMTGIYREVARPERLVYTESWGGKSAENVSTVELSEDCSVTHMRMTKLFPSQEARDMALKSGIQGGVTVSFANLAEVLTLVKIDLDQ